MSAQTSAGAGAPPPGPDAKRAAAAAAVALVRDGARLGLGSGSTAAQFVRLLGERAARDGLSLTCVATSRETEALAREVGLAVSELDAVGDLDLTVDGADEIDPELHLIKGGGGALLREKIVAASSAQMLVIADESKCVERLGAFALPVEVARFGWSTTLRRIETFFMEAPDARGPQDADGQWPAPPQIALREAGGAPFVTDEGHYILDVSGLRINDPVELGLQLVDIPGVMETGVFAGLATAAIIGAPDGGVRRIDAEDLD